MKKVLTIVLPLILYSFPAHPKVTSQIPNGSINIAYRQLDNGKLSNSVHDITVICFDGNCSLTTLTLNQCFELSAGNGFFPKAESTSTREGNLKARVVKPDTLLLEETYQSTIFKYEITFDVRKGPDGKPWFKSVTNFSGSVVKQSDILNKVISWDLVPLKGDFVFVTPECDMVFKGIEAK